MGTELVKTDAAERGVTERDEFGATQVQRTAETAISAVAAQAKALVESRFIVALRMRRNTDDVRVRLLKTCKNPAFARTALYTKPIGKDQAKWPRGLSIRFAEEAIRESGNIDVSLATLWDDDERRVTRVSVIDLETNSGYSKDITVTKTVERKFPTKGQQPISVRQNSYGDTVYLVVATDDEVQTKEAALTSKIIRTLGLRLIPEWIKIECREAIESTIADAHAKDPDAERKRLLDAFALLGVLPAKIQEYLGADIATLTPAQLIELRGIYSAIKDGDATWADVMALKGGSAEGAEEVPVGAGVKGLKDSIEKAKAKAAGKTETPKPEAPPEAKPPTFPGPAQPEQPSLLEGK